MYTTKIIMKIVNSMHHNHHSHYCCGLSYYMIPFLFYFLFMILGLYIWDLWKIPNTNYSKRHSCLYFLRSKLIHIVNLSRDKTIFLILSKIVLSFLLQYYYYYPIFNMKSILKERKCITKTCNFLYPAPLIIFFK